MGHRPHRDIDDVLILEGLSKRFRQGSSSVTGLDDVSLTLRRGDFTAVMGPSGSGKTTMLQMAGLLDHPDSGRVILEGGDMTDLPERRRSQIRLERCGFVFQEHNLIPVLTAFENAEMVLLLQGLGASERLRRVGPLFEAFGMAELLDRRPEALSGGQRQRVAVIRAVAANPSVLFCDEPTAGLDTEAARGVMDLLEHMHRERGATILLTTHDDRIARRARRLLRLTDGRISEDRCAADG